MQQHGNRTGDRTGDEFDSAGKQELSRYREMARQRICIGGRRNSFKEIERQNDHQKSQ